MRLGAETTGAGEKEKENAPRVLASPPLVRGGGGAEEAQFLQLLGWNWMQVCSAAAYLIGYLDAVPCDFIIGLGGALLEIT